MAATATQQVQPGTGRKERKANQGTLAATTSKLVVVQKDSPLRTRLQPVDFFAGQQGKASELFVVGKYLVVQREVDGTKIFQAYTEAGKLAEMKFVLPGGKLTTHSIAKGLKQLGKDGLSLVNQDFENKLGYKNVGDTIGAAEWDKSLLHENAKKHCSVSSNSWDYEYVNLKNLEQQDVPLLEISYELTRIPERNGLLYRSKNRAIVIETMPGNNEQCPPVDWARYEIPDINSIDAKTRKAVPSLDAFLSRQGNANEYAVSLEQGIVKITKGRDRDLTFSEEATAVARATHDKNIVCFTDAQSGELKTFSLDSTNGVDTPVEAKKLPFNGKVQALALDPGGNFAICAAEDNTGITLYIVDKETGSIQGEFKNASAKFELDADGNIFYIDSDAKLRIIQTNFAKLPKGGVAQARSERLAELETVGASLDDLDLVLITPRKRGKGDPVLRADQLLESTQLKLLARFEPAIAKAETLESVAGISDRLETIRTNPAYEKFPEVFEPVEAKIRSRIDEIRVGGFKKKLDVLMGELPELDTPGELVRMDKEVGRLGRERRDLVIFDAKLRGEVDTTLRTIRAKVAEVHEKVQGEIATSLGEKFDTIKAKAATVATIPELQILQGEKESLEFSELLSVVRDAAARQEWMVKYKTLIDTRKDALVQEIEVEEEAERKTVALAIEEGAQILEEIREQIDEIGTPAEFATFRTTSPLLKKIKAKHGSLPEEHRIAEEEKLTVLLQNRERSIAAKSSLGGAATATGVRGKDVTFGKESFPIFKAPPLVWLPKVISLHDGSPLGMLAYQSNLGHLFPAPCDPVPTSIEHPDTKTAVINTQAAATAFFDTVKRKPPGFDSNWVINDFYRDRLDAVARICRSQLQNQRGMLILESDAGAGKNVLCDMFAHFTNREVHMFSCNFQTEKEDLTTAFKFDPKKGTYSLDAELLRKLQTPGAVICFDEINALPTGVTKLLNPALDYRRALYLPDGRVIKIDPTVILLGTMNPQSYLGVKPLSPEVKSRARMMPVPYPPEKVGGKYAPYEAEILAKQVSCLKTLKQDEFYALWNYIVNGDGTSGGDRYTSKERERATKDLLQIVKSANRVREAYNAFKSGKSTEPVTLVFSIRETIDIASELSSGAKVKEIIKEVILPKIGDMDERERVEVVVDQS